MPGWTTTRRAGQIDERERPPEIPLDVLLDFAMTYSAHNSRAIWQRLHLSQANYVQQLNRAIDREEAYALRPALVQRLRDEREANRERRRLSRIRCSVCGSTFDAGGWEHDESTGEIRCRNCGARTTTKGEQA